MTHIRIFSNVFEPKNLPMMRWHFPDNLETTKKRVAFNRGFIIDRDRWRIFHLFLRMNVEISWARLSVKRWWNLLYDWKFKINFGIWYKIQIFQQWLLLGLWKISYPCEIWVNLDHVNRQYDVPQANMKWFICWTMIIKYLMVGEFVRSKSNLHLLKERSKILRSCSTEGESCFCCKLISYLFLI